VLSFVIAGWVWVGTLRILARRVGLSANVGSVSFSAALGAVPLLLPAPWVGWALAQTPAGASWEKFVAACLRREFTGAPAALTPAYFTAALVALAVEVALLRRQAGSLRYRVFLWIVASLVGATVLIALFAAGMGLLVARWG
jgi:small-conductance mechanosensitive channel